MTLCSDTTIVGLSNGVNTDYQDFKDNKMTNAKAQMIKRFNYQCTKVLTFEFIHGHLFLSSENNYQRLSAIICVPI